jgi:hypothetical protein
MNSISIDELKAFNYEFENVLPKLEKLITFDNLVKESTFLNSIESVIPKSISFDLHFDMIIEGRTAQYHKTLNKGRNLLLESSKIPDSLHASITEAIESLKHYITTAINEAEAIQLGDPTGSFNPVAPLTARLGNGTWPTLKGLWNAVTEGGSVIGIIQFIIDIIGLVGDFIFPGAGVVADIINAIIYAIRGEWLLCAISIIAAVVIGGGDILKAYKPLAKSASPIFVKLATKGGAQAAADALAKTGAKESVGIIKFLNKIAQFIGGALGIATSKMGLFIQNIGKVLGYVPGLGAIMKPIFEGLGKVLKAFGDKMSLFTSNLKVLEKEAAALAIRDLDEIIKTGRGSAVLTPDAKYLKIIKDGKPKLIPTKFINATEYFTMTYSKDGAQFLFKNSGDFLKNWKLMNATFVDPAVNKKFLGHFAKYYKSRKKAFKVNSALIIGKAIYRFIYGEDWKPGKRWTRAEVEGHGNGAFNDWINREMEKKKKSTDADIVTSVTLNSTEEEVFDRVTNYHNHYAQITGSPTIVDAMADKFKNEKTMATFNSLFSDIASGKIKNDSANDKSVDVTADDDYDTVVRMNNYENQPMGESLIKTAFSFSDFKKL